MRLSVYLLGYRVFVAEIDGIESAAAVPEKVAERAVKHFSRAWTRRLFR